MVSSKYGEDPSIVVSDKQLPDCFSVFLGTVNLPKRKYVYRASLDDVGTADIFFQENATLVKNDRANILHSLSSSKLTDSACFIGKKRHFRT